MDYHLDRTRSHFKHGIAMSIVLATPTVSRHHRWPPLLAFSLAFLATGGTRAAEIWVITDRQHPVAATPSMRFIELDAPARIEAELDVQLPADPVRAIAIVQQRLRDGGTELQRRLRLAYQGVADAWSLRVVKIPAVVVDQSYVVYGDPDVNRALARIEAYRRSRP
jgi:integrating conjugative element protein (TIGR03757 family)